MLDETRMEKRSYPREWRSEPVWWHQQNGAQAHQGWLLERSATGAAFIARGRNCPLPGMKICTLDDGAGDGSKGGREGLVMRVNHIHADLFLVAAQFAGPLPS